MRHDQQYNDWKQYYDSLNRPRYSMDTKVKLVRNLFPQVTPEMVLNYSDIKNTTGQVSRDLEFYKEQYDKHKQQKDLICEMTDLLLHNVKPVALTTYWEPEPRSSELPEEVLLCLNADQHIGMIVDEKEAPPGGQEYNPEVAELRVKDYSRTVLKITEYRRMFEQINDVHLVYLGDGIEGDWRGLNMSKDNIVEQYSKAFEIFLDQVVFFASHFRHVYIHCVYGNHSRMDKGLPEYVNWEYIFWSYIMGLRLRNIKNVTLDVPSQPYCNFQIYDWKFCAIHGGGIKMHYKTPYYGIETAQKEYNEVFQDLEQDRIDYLLLGHFHECASLKNNKIKMCGSTVGYHPWAMSAMRKYSPPSQKMLYVHKKHKISNDSDINL